MGDVGLGGGRAGCPDRRQQFGILQPSDLPSGGYLVDQHLIRTGGRGVAAVRRDGHGIDGVKAGRQRLPGDRPRAGDLAGGALVDPEPEQAQLLRAEVVRVAIVVGGRHHRLLAVCRHREEQAVVGLTGHDGRSRHAPLEDHPRRLQHQLALRHRHVVAGQAVAAEDRQDFFFEVDRTRVRHVGDGQRLGRLGGKNRRGEQGGQPPCMKGSADAGAAADAWVAIGAKGVHGAASILSSTGRSSCKPCPL